MGQPIGVKPVEKPRVLVAPLDWGLGHATRCIPLIRELLAGNCDPWLAGEGLQESILRSEFPSLPFLSLPGYRVRYSRNATGSILKIMLQLPKINARIRKENEWLKQAQAKYSFDAVISDNRFGLHHPGVKCIFMTHQLAIKGRGKWSERRLQHWNYRHIDQFNECWVPDLSGGNSLAGELSHPVRKPAIPVKYIGPLSRFQTSSGKTEKNHLLILLSGPEPQRSILEKIMIDQASHYPHTATIVRGLPGAESFILSSEMIGVFNHLPAEQLREEMEKAEWVIARCGYSTVMDLVKMQKKSILIPTPGQTEQGYLGKHLFGARVVFCRSQKNFSLEESLREAKGFAYQLPQLNFEGMRKEVKELIDSL